MLLVKEFSKFYMKEVYVHESCFLYQFKGFWSDELRRREEERKEDGGESFPRLTHDLI